MSTILEMQIDELQEENDALKAINQKLKLEKNALKEQLALYGVVSTYNCDCCGSKIGTIRKVCHICIDEMQDRD